MAAPSGTETGAPTFAGSTFAGVRNHKVTLINAKLALPAREEPTHLEDIELDWEVTDFLELVPKLSLLDRYERRAYAQRNKALRKLAHL